MNNMRAAIIDYGMGNLFSVKSACSKVGLDAVITSSKEDLLQADAAILPGVGAFGKAMETLDQLGLSSGIKEFIGSGRPFLGICLGMQLLMSESEEFGRHKGLGIIPGTVTKFHAKDRAGASLKVPHVGWNRIVKDGRSWDETILQSLTEGDYFYFVHSFCVKPDQPGNMIASAVYGDQEFCASLQRDNVMACQFHPERSALKGIKIYENFATIVKESYERRNNIVNRV